MGVCKLRMAKMIRNHTEKKSIWRRACIQSVILWANCLTSKSLRHSERQENGLTVAATGSPPRCNLNVWPLIIKQPTVLYNFVLLLFIHYTWGVSRSMLGNELLGGGLRSPTVVLVLLTLLSLCDKTHSSTWRSTISSSRFQTSVWNIIYWPE